MAETPKRTKAPLTQELFAQVLAKLDRQDKRLKAIETQQTLMLSALQRQGQTTEDINKRCMEKLGLKCPLVEDPEENGGDGAGEGVGEGVEAGAEEGGG
jgi:hypothetical protein